ncbi:unnamed protein product [Chilo suppressalis]|uniref:Uncharacterized protein n=1 Tax=Chilo suppressalis TaxID=168631 RepID=A0ABN8B5B9_CHISP|nr:unnamed protein product [Chilo suppressalis]
MQDRQCCSPRQIPQIQKLERENEQFRNTSQDLTLQLHHLEQLARTNNIEIQLNTAHLGYGGDKKSAVFVTEHLTPETKSLHAAARLKIKQLDYKFVCESPAAVTGRPSVTPETSRECTCRRAYAAAAASRPVDAALNCERRNKQQTEKIENSASNMLLRQRHKIGFRTKRVSLKWKGRRGSPFAASCVVPPRPERTTCCVLQYRAALYVSRLHYSTKEEEIVEYLLIKTKLSLRVAR